jgi:hypothetical protein
MNKYKQVRIDPDKTHCKNLKCAEESIFNVFISFVWKEKLTSDRLATIGAK